MLRFGVVASPGCPHVGPRTLIAVGKFDKRENFMRAIFSDGIDRLGSQLKTFWIVHLQTSNRFNVLNRDNVAELKQEAQFKKDILPDSCRARNL